MYYVGYLYYILYVYYYGYGGGVYYMVYGKFKVFVKEKIEEEKGDIRVIVKGKRGCKKLKLGRKGYCIRWKYIFFKRSKDKIEIGMKFYKSYSFLVKYYKVKEVIEKVNKKNFVVIYRLFIIYYLLLEIYYRFDIVVYCVFIVFYCVLIIYY